MRLFPVLFCTFALFSISAVTVPAETQWRDDDLSYDKARRALDKGEILSLQEVVKYLRGYSSDSIVSIEYEYEFGRWVYEFKLVDQQGRISRVHVDARIGEIINVADY